MDGNYAALFVSVLIIGGLFLAFRGMILSGRKGRAGRWSVWELVGFASLLICLVGLLLFRPLLDAVLSPNQTALVGTALVWICFFGYLLAADRDLSVREKTSAGE